MTQILQFCNYIIYRYHSTIISGWIIIAIHHSLDYHTSFTESVIFITHDSCNGNETDFVSTLLALHCAVQISTCYFKYEFILLLYFHEILLINVLNIFTVANGQNRGFFQTPRTPLVTGLSRSVSSGTLLPQKFMVFHVYLTWTDFS